MYYDLEKHSDYEYIIYCKLENSKPYVIPRSFDSLDDVLEFIDSEKKRFNRYGKNIFVDNEFYKNESNRKDIYYKIYCRKIGTWEEVTEKNSKKACNLKSNIIYLGQERSKERNGSFLFK